MATLAPRFTEVARRIRQPISPQQTILANGAARRKPERIENEFQQTLSS